jgi:hypothetical protein
VCRRRGDFIIQFRMLTRWMPVCRCLKDSDPEVRNSAAKVRERRAIEKQDTLLLVIGRMLFDKNNPRCTHTEPFVRAQALLSMAGMGNHRAVEGVMSDVECILTYGLGVPGLGVKGTPEASARGQLFGEDGMGTRDQKRRDMEEQVCRVFVVYGLWFRV